MIDFEKLIITCFFIVIITILYKNQKTNLQVNYVEDYRNKINSDSDEDSDEDDVKCECFSHVKNYFYNQ